MILTSFQKDNEYQKNLALMIGQSTLKKISTNLPYQPTFKLPSNTKNKNVDTTPRYKNDNPTRQFRNHRTMTVVGAKETVGKPKQVKDSTYHKEKMLLCKQVEKGVLLQAEQYDWLADTDEEINE
ncbi:hypothetical protein Tco_0613060 [Tanacetum coccineum]